MPTPCSAASEPPNCRHRSDTSSATWRNLADILGRVQVEGRPDVQLPRRGVAVERRARARAVEDLPQAAGRSPAAAPAARRRPRCRWSAWPDPCSRSAATARLAARPDELLLGDVVEHQSASPERRAVRAPRADPPRRRRTRPAGSPRRGRRRARAGTVPARRPAGPWSGRTAVGRCARSPPARDRGARRSPASPRRPSRRTARPGPTRGGLGTTRSTAEVITARVPSLPHTSRVRSPGLLQCPVETVARPSLDEHLREAVRRSWPRAARRRGRPGREARAGPPRRGRPRRRFRRPARPRGPRRAPTVVP